MAEKCAKFFVAVAFSFLTMVAIVFSILAVAVCDYVTYADDQGETKMAGLFKFEVPGEMGQCVTYTESEVDSLSNLEKTAMVRVAFCIYLLCLVLVLMAISYIYYHIPHNLCTLVGMRISGPVLRHRRPGPGCRGAVPVRQVLHRPVRFHIVLVRNDRPVAHVHVLAIGIVLQRYGLQYGRRGDLQYRGR